MLSSKSAVVIIPPNHLWEPIQRIRSKYDRAYERWMPHINLVFPFLSDAEFPRLAEKLKGELSHISPFSISFTKDSIGYFEPGQRCVLWLKPLLYSQKPMDTVSELQVPDIVYASNCDTNASKLKHKKSRIQAGNSSPINNTTSIPCLENLRYAVWKPGDATEELQTSEVGLHNLRNAVWQPGENDFTMVNDEASPRKITKIQPSISFKEKENSPLDNVSSPASQERNSPEMVKSSDEFHPSVMVLQKVLERVFPDCNDLSVKSDKGFQPHLTLGQFNSKEIKKVVSNLKKDWKPVDFRVDEIYFISRKGYNDPFEIRKNIALGI